MTVKSTFRNCIASIWCLKPIIVWADYLNRYGFCSVLSLLLEGILSTGDRQPLPQSRLGPTNEQRNIVGRPDRVPQEHMSLNGLRDDDFGLLSNLSNGQQEHLLVTYYSLWSKL